MFDDALMIYWMIVLNIMIIDDHHNEQNCVERSINTDWYVESSSTFERIDDFHKLSKNISRFVEHSIVELIERLMIQQEMKMLQKQMYARTNVKIDVDTNAKNDVTKNSIDASSIDAIDEIERNRSRLNAISFNSFFRFQIIENNLR